MTYEDWLKTVPEAITGDTLWKMRMYQTTSMRSVLPVKAAIGIMRHAMSWRPMSLSIVYPCLRRSTVCF